MSNLYEKFVELMSTKEGIAKMKMPPKSVWQFKKSIKNGVSIKHSTLVKYVGNAGFHFDSSIYTRKDLVSLANFAIKLNKFGKSLGPEYVVEKWELSQKQS